MTCIATSSKSMEYLYSIQHKAQPNDGNFAELNPANSPILRTSYELTRIWTSTQTQQTQTSLSCRHARLSCRHNRKTTRTSSHKIALTMPQYIVDVCIRVLGIWQLGKPVLLIRVPLFSIGNFGKLPLCMDAHCTIYRLHQKYIYRVQIVIKDVQIRMMLPACVHQSLAHLSTLGLYNNVFHWNFRRNMLFDSRIDFRFTSECASVLDIESSSEPSFVFVKRLVMKEHSLY